MPERRHRVRDHLEQPRWQRGERRGERRATANLCVCQCTPLAREHHGDEHLEPLHALHADALVSAVALVAVSRDG